MESGDVLRVTNVLWVLELGRSVLSVSTIEKKGFDVLFPDGQVLIKPRGSSSDTVVVLGVRESNLYRLKGQPMRAMASSVDVFVASGGIPTLALVSGMWNLCWHSHCIFDFVKTLFVWSWGLELLGLLGLHTHMEE
jgi:hypothetical protein